MRIFKKTVLILCVFIFVLTLTCCVSNKKTEDDWGSFSSEEKQYSYDGAYYSIQEVRNAKINICVYSVSDDELVFEAEPCRSSDYWGMVWESDRDAFWIQSGDIGVFCYELEDDVWQLNSNRERPEDIVSKYDSLIEK